MQSLSGKVLRIEVLERHFVDNALGLLSKNVIGALQNQGTADARLLVEDASRQHDTLVAAVTISLQGVELYERTGVHGWYPLQMKDTAYGLAAVGQQMDRRQKRLRRSVLAGVTGIGDAIFKSGGRASMTADGRGVLCPAGLHPNLEEEDVSDRGVIEYSAISGGAFVDMVADGSVADSPHIDMLIIAQQR